MSGPIVRTGTTPKFWENWDRVFGGKKSATGGAKSAAKSTEKKQPAAKGKKKK